MVDNISNGPENEEMADYLSLNYEKNLIFFKKKVYRAVQKLFANLLKWTELNLQNHQQERLDTY